MEKQVLSAIMIDQKSHFSERSGLIDRDLDLNLYLNTQQVLVITGVRRCGKSSLLTLIRNKMGLLENEFCYFNFDDERIIPETSILAEIYSIHLELYRTEPVFFFDEIQLVPAWEKFVNRMHEQGRKIIVTGSNATLLSSEIATTLTGRNKVLELYPFSFKEYLRYANLDYHVSKLTVKQLSLLKNDLNYYLSFGGFPVVLREKDLDLINGWFQDILYRDIVSRYRISSVAELRHMALYLASNTAKLFSYATLLSISGLKSLNSVKDYLHYFEMGYLFFYLRKFDYSVKKQIINSRKVYAIDNAIPARLGFKFSEDKGRLMENAVFLELKRRNLDIYYHSGKFECDFLIVDGLKVVQAIQVTYQLSPENQHRELAGLQEAMQQFNCDDGLIISFEQEFYKDELPDNVKIIPLYRWLLGG